ncbi:hypothetical protein Tco_1476076 [Tanacetum coccineum]
MGYPTGQNYDKTPLWLGPLRGGYGYDEESPSSLIRWIEELLFLDGLKVSPHVGYYDGKGDLDNFIHVFEGAMRMEKWSFLKATMDSWRKYTPGCKHKKQPRKADHSLS